MIIRRRRFGRWPDARRTSTRAVGFCRWLRFGTGWTGDRRRRSAAWTGRRCAVHRFNASGPDGLIDNWTEGPKPRLSEEPLAQFAQIVEAGPDREVDGVVRWRRIDLKRVIAERFGVDFHPRYVGKLLHKLGFSHMSARPRHPAQDERIVEAFKKISRAR
jgi:transposase